MEKIKKTSDAKKGGLFVGKSHDEGGIPAIVVDTGQPIEVESGEAIINKKATAKHWKELSKINQSTGGVPIPAPDRADELLDKFEKGGKLTILEKKTIHSKWKRLVNMTYSQLKKYYDSKDGKASGLTQKEADDLGIDSGRESAVWIMKMKRTNYKDWTPEMWRWAKKQISFVSRMRGNKGELMENGKRTPKLKSLLIWGHNPYKFEGGGDIPKESKFPVDANSLQVMLKYASKDEVEEIQEALDAQKKEYKEKYKKKKQERYAKGGKMPEKASDIAFAIRGAETLLKYADESEKADIETYIKGLQILDKMSPDETPAKKENLVFKDKKYDITYSVEQRPDGRWTIYAESPNFKKNDQYAPSGLASKEDAIDLAKLSAGITKEEDPEALFMQKELNDYKETQNSINKKLSELGFIKNPSNLLMGKKIDENTYIQPFYDKNKKLYKIRGVKKFNTSLGGNSIGIQYDFDNEKDFFDKINEFLSENNNFKDGGSVESPILLAPNGNPSNLTPEQYKLVRTPEFKAWFGDWEQLSLTKINDSAIDDVSLKKIQDSVSKVVDKNGEPMVVYHGTFAKEINVFDQAQIGYNSGNEGHYGFGFYFSVSMQEAKTYTSTESPNILHCFLNIKNPFIANKLEHLELYSKDFGYPENKEPVAIDSKWIEKALKNFNINAFNLYKSIKNNGFDYQRGWKLFLDKNPDAINDSFDLNLINDWIEFDGDNEKFSKQNESQNFNSSIPDYILESISNELNIPMSEIKTIDQYTIGNYPNLLYMMDLGNNSRYLTDRIKKDGFDGILAGSELVVFKSNQIKLADGSNTKFDLSNPDIRFKRGGVSEKSTYKEKYNKKYGYDLNESHSLKEISEDTGVSMKGLQQIYNKGVGAYRTNPESVRPNVKSPEQWAKARVYSSVMGGKSARIDANELKMEKGGSVQNNIIVIESPIEMLDEINFNAQFKN